jgi:hypothetical protein
MIIRIEKINEEIQWQQQKIMTYYSFYDRVGLIFVYMHVQKKSTISLIKDKRICSFAFFSLHALHHAVVYK